MNGTEQKQRRTAVQTAERRIDDMETVIRGLAQVIVDDRKAIERQIDGQYAALWKDCCRAHNRLDAHDCLTFLQRVRWLLTGRHQ